ncbi:hypothetical protein CsSME_00008600 [Camellia sinensis var. sinensis]
MGRAPCCEKMGLKKGPWTAEEDQLLIAFIRQHGHGNWRALPKQAGLLRCEKSCRLRWTNYLRPDIKRGREDDYQSCNSEEDEEDAENHTEDCSTPHHRVGLARLPTDNRLLYHFSCADMWNFWC